MNSSLGTDGKQYVVRVCVLFRKIVRIVGSNKGNVHLPGPFREIFFYFGLLFHPVVLQFQVEVVFAENVQILIQRLPGFSFPATQQFVLDFTADACAHTDKAVDVFGKAFFIYAGLVIESFQVSFAVERAKVVITALVLGQEYKVEALSVGVAGIFFGTMDGCNVKFATDNRLDFLFFRSLIKLYRTRHIPMIGTSYRRHTVFSCAVNNGLDGCRAIK